MVAITGDLVDGGVKELGAQIAPLADLRSRCRTFFVTGNHEYYSSANSWIVELRRLGFTVLLNEHVMFEAPAGAPLVLAGVTDFGAADFDAAHRSDPATAASAGFHLQLSGHARRAVLPMEFVCALSAAVHGGPAEMGKVVGLIRAGAPATGYRPSAAARRPRSRICGW